MGDSNIHKQNLIGREYLSNIKYCLDLK